ncbi:hypothetical protein F5Y15DRAFT_422430 [Xylariaceae sp. FL0016]|nr:hypothetical protein F5Y15DRAFT_422430 [Xylariaceae sp. FL0016]
MWILESDGEAFGGATPLHFSVASVRSSELTYFALLGRRLWLRPGKRYLFGRTVAEPGQLAIQGEGADKVSRKHVTISVAAVEEGDAENMSRRSRVTVEDLGSKGGTKVNDRKYRGESCELPQVSNTLQMGSFPTMFRITWFPVVLSFSYTGNQLRSNPLGRLRESLEQLDIKLLADYDVELTTHVVTKKRNTPKGLQALINGRFVVNDDFVNAIVQMATPGEGETPIPSPLESDFDGCWPDATQFLPSPGEEPVPRAAEAFAPNPARAELFDGYTFVFYSRKQFESLLAPITNGKGKALYREVVARETQIDDFIRYVKGVAGEKGLGEFEDGSEGRGVVVVKWMPASDEDFDWFADFFRSISLRLDHRLIDQKDFLDAILGNDASVLRRPLEFATQPESSQMNTPSSAVQQPMEVDEEPAPEPPRRPIRRRVPVKSRFAGFSTKHSDSDSSDGEALSNIPAAPVVSATPNNPSSHNDSQEGLFVSQEAAQDDPEETGRASRRSQRKRPGSPVLRSQDVMDGIAPTAAQIKRRRIAAGEDPVSRRETTPLAADTEAPRIRPKRAKTKKELDVLELARQHREEAEMRAKDEREELEAEPGDLDLAEIRRLHIEEEMPLREEVRPQRSREQDIADGRWDPAWNGRKNFKRFRQRGVVQGRAPERIIVQLEEVKTKDFGIGDDYWLGKENHTQQARKSQQASMIDESIRSRDAQDRGRREVSRGLGPVDSSDEEDEDQGQDRDMAADDSEDGDDLVLTSRSRSSRAGGSSTHHTQQPPSGRSTRTSQAAASQPKTQASSGNASSVRTGAGSIKRTAPPGREQPAKRSKVVSRHSDDDDDSDDGLRFRFGRKR